MKRRDFNKTVLTMGAGLAAGSLNGISEASEPSKINHYREPAKDLPIREFDVVVAGGGTAGVVAALAAARQGAKTMLIESKGYTGGTVTEGGTALHSFYNLWKAFPGVKKRQVVRGIPQQIIDRLMLVGGTNGHSEMLKHYDYDSVCTAIDTEMYKLVTMQMLDEAGVFIAVNTLAADAIVEGSKVKGVITESRSGREAVMAKAFVDCTAYGDLCARAGAEYKEMNDYHVCNSIGMANVNVEKYYAYMKEHDAVLQIAYGKRGDQDYQIVRVGAIGSMMPVEFKNRARQIEMSSVTTTVHDNYFMFIKVNLRLPKNPVNRDVVARGELELRKRQLEAVQIFRDLVPGCEKAFIARTSPSLNIRRARCITCDYDITIRDVVKAVHFDDEVMVYGFHDNAPKYQVENGGTYGVPYRALRVKGFDNLLAAGMLITSDHDAHMSTRNTVCSMGQGQGAGTAAALCAGKNCTTRELPYPDLRKALEKDNVYFET